MLEPVHDERTLPILGAVGYRKENGSRERANTRTICTIMVDVWIIEFEHKKEHYMVELELKKSSLIELKSNYQARLFDNDLDNVNQKSSITETRDERFQIPNIPNFVEILPKT